MMIDFYFPASFGEWCAFASALITIGFGFLLLLMPRLSLRILRLQTLPNVPSAISESRATMAGFYLGVGFCCIFFMQPFLYLALGAGWLITAFGRIISIILDNGNSRYNWISCLVEVLLGLLPILYFLGMI